MDIEKPLSSQKRIGERVQIVAVQKFSLSDFPSHISAILFTKGCNFLCPFCHNHQTLDSDSEILDDSEILNFLESRRGKLSGVVVSGGEPTLQKDLVPFLKEIKGMGFAIKFDTNGSNPDTLRELLDLDILDYIAMDIKLPLNQYPTYSKVDNLSNRVKRSTEIIKSSKIDYEFRTTTIREIHNIDLLVEMVKEITPFSRYILQDFVPENAFDLNYKQYSPYKEDEKRMILERLKMISKNIGWR